MSAFYDQASLVVVPSGYKSGKIYAQKPLTTDGQLTFTRASTATRVNASGLIETVASGVPRLDYLNSSCPRLLLEPQRTNLITYSEQFNNAAWGKDSSITVSANYSISPDGYQNADRLQKAVTGGAEGFSQNFFGLTAGSYTISFYAKSNTSSNQNTNILFGAFQTQSITITPSWQRFTKTFTAATTVDYNGMITSNALDVSIFGWQMEAGAYATSYIPTLGTSVTRVADANYKTGVSSLIGQTEGVIYAEVQNTSIGSISGADNAVITIEGATFNDVVGILYQPDGTIYGLTIVGGALQTLVTANVGITSAFKKIAFAYKANDFALYIDGVQVGTDTSGTIPTCSNIALGNYYNGGTIQVINAKAVKQALLFKTRLPNSDLATLTSL